MFRPPLAVPPRRLAALSLLIAATLSLAGCASGDAAPTPAGPPTVPVASPSVADAPRLLELPGHVEAVERVELASRVGGIIQRIAFAEGARVRRGELLVELDAKPFEAALARAEADWREARAAAELAAAEAARAERLLARKAISAEDAARRATEATLAAARRDAAAAERRRARIALDDTRVRAPIDGRIGRAERTAGNHVAAGERLAVLVADARVYVRVDIPETALGDHGVADWQARFVLPEQPLRPFTGRLAFLDNEISAGTGTLRARLVLDGDPALIPGRYGAVQLQRGEFADAVLVEETAIGADQGTRYVLVVDAAGLVHYRPVVLGPRVGTQRVITEGLAASERIVTGGLMGVRPGMTVAAASPDSLAGGSSSAAARGEE